MEASRTNSDFPIEELSTLLTWSKEHLLWQHPGSLLTNDYGYSKYAQAVNEARQSDTGGMGIFVGSGGLLSMLPDLRLDLAVVVDKNPSVIALNRYLATIVSAAQSPDEALGLLSQELENPTIPDIEHIMRFVEPEYIYVCLEGEANRYDANHWTDPNRFIEARQALQDTSLVWARSDIRDANFRNSLNIITERYDLPLTFANFTNVHQWFDGYQYPKSMEYLRQWPLAENPVI